MKVLMATDGSKDAVTALQTAGRLLRTGVHHSVDLVCVAPELQVAQGKGKAGKPAGGMSETYRQQIIAETERILGEGQRFLRVQGLEARGLAELGSASSVILQLAFDYDLTVVGAHDRYGRSQRGLGPVASRILAHSAGAVLVGRELTAERSLRVLVAVDGSTASERALQMVASEFNLGSAEITLIHVVETPWLRLGLEPEWFDYSARALDRSDTEESLENDLRLRADDIVERARIQIEKLGLSASTMIEEGDPALEILSEAEKGDYDLIVLGASGVAGLKHDILGSVSSKLAQDALCSVLIVRIIE